LLPFDSSSQSSTAETRLGAHIDFKIYFFFGEAALKFFINHVCLNVCSEQLVQGKKHRCSSIFPIQPGLPRGCTNTADVFMLYVQHKRKAEYLSMSAFQHFLLFFLFYSEALYSDDVWFV